MGLINLDAIIASAPQTFPPLNFARSYVYRGGSDVLATLFVDPNLTETLANPHIADASGSFKPCYVIDGPYRIELRDDQDVVVHSFNRNILTESNQQGNGPDSYGAVLDGVTDDTATFQIALSSASKLEAQSEAVASVSDTLDVPSSARWVDLRPITIRQEDGANLDKLISHHGYGNDHGQFRARLDGNRANNSTPVIGCQVDATMAGDLVDFDISGRNCDTLLKIVKEVEHCNIRASARGCGTVFEIDTTTNTSDENNIEVYGYQSDTLFKTTGTSKSSGQVDVFGEVIDNWGVDLENGWYSLGGVVRGCGGSSGGGCRVTSTSGGRVHFRGLQLYGATPTPNNGTWGLMMDSTSTWCEGDLILGAFDGGAWIKSCQEGSKLRLNVSTAAAYSDGLRLGDVANNKTVNASAFDVAVAGAAEYGVNVDKAKNSTIRMHGEVTGTLAGVRISNASFDNRLEIGRGMALSVTLVNERTACDNVILFQGSYTPSDIAQINGGNYFPGMWLEEMRLEGGLRSSAYYDSDVNAWVPTSAMMDEKGAGAIGNASNQVNLAGKYCGKLVWDATNDRVMRALSAAPTGTWISLDGTGSITPS